MTYRYEAMACVSFLDVNLGRSDLEDQDCVPGMCIVQWDSSPGMTGSDDQVENSRVNGVDLVREGCGDRGSPNS